MIEKVLRESEEGVKLIYDYEDSEAIYLDLPMPEIDIYQEEGERRYNTRARVRLWISDWNKLAGTIEKPKNHAAEWCELMNATLNEKKDE